LLPGFEYAPFGDLEAVKKLIDGETCAILIEPIQGEGGIRIPPDGFLKGLRQLADENELLLIFDEVQSGCGRTGKWFAYQHAGVSPDVMTLAKSVCGGVAGAALLTTAEIAPSLRPGMHAATFGGNPIAARAGIATIETIENEGLLDRAVAIGERFRTRLAPLVDELAIVKELRVCGLMIGLELSIDGAALVQKCLDQGLLINSTQQTVIRLLPAMTLSDEQVDEGCEILANVLRNHQSLS
jgi:acetylornithine/N-succinyldiaminopimelate aminotransferase